MRGTVHLALGRVYEGAVGSDRERNESAIHLDMLVDAREDALVERDGEPLVRDGEFVP